MQFTDSHCHLDYPELSGFGEASKFSKKLSELLLQCHTQNIHRIIVPAVNPEHWQRVLSLTEQNRTIDIACSIGIHPWFIILQDHQHSSSRQIYDVTFQAQQLKQAISINSENYRNKIVAIGECGIDVFKAKRNTQNEQAFNDNIVLQQDFFDMQLSVAQENNLPVIVHHCQSHALILPLLKKHKLSKAGVIHAFSGSYQQAKAYVDLGFKIGVGATITYPRAKKTINAIKNLPLSSLLLETDAPAMPPFGMQGTHNSPLNLVAVFQALVTIRSETEEVIAKQIESNVEQLFFS